MEQAHYIRGKNAKQQSMKKLSVRRPTKGKFNVFSNHLPRRIIFAIFGARFINLEGQQLWLLRGTS